MPYHGGNINACSNNEANNDEVSPDQPTDDKNINYNYNDEKNDYMVTSDTPTNGGNNKTVDNNEEKRTKMKLRRKQMTKT